MARSWSKDRERKLAASARSADYADMVTFSDPPELSPSKDELRAETERLMAEFKGPIRRLKTVVSLQCRTCNHRGTARVEPGTTDPNFKCRACGSSLVKIRY